MEGRGPDIFCFDNSKIDDRLPISHHNQVNIDIITDFIEAEDKIKLSPLVFDRINYGHESDFTGLQYYFDQLDNIIIKDEYLEFTIKLTAHIKLNDGDFIFGV